MLAVAREIRRHFYLNSKDMTKAEQPKRKAGRPKGAHDKKPRPKIVEWVEIRSERTDAQEFKHTCLSAASIVICLVVGILLYFVVKENIVTGKQIGRAHV